LTGWGRSFMLVAAPPSRPASGSAAAIRDDDRPAAPVLPLGAIVLVYKLKAELATRAVVGQDAAAQDVPAE
jgi:hypothetical protein